MEVVGRGGSLQGSRCMDELLQDARIRIRRLVHHGLAVARCIFIACYLLFKGGNRGYGKGCYIQFSLYKTLVFSLLHET
jgi:hypothetical protein